MTSDELTPPSPTPTEPLTAPAGQPPVDLLTSLGVTAPRLVRAVTIGALTYAATWLASLVVTLLAVVAAHLEDAGSEIDYWWVLAAPGQLVAMAFRSPASMSVTSSDDDFGFGGSLSTTAPLLLILVVALVAAFRLSRRDESTSPNLTTKAAVTLAVTSAVVFAAMAWLLALVLKLSVSEDGTQTTYGAAHIQLILFGVVAIALVALVGRRPWHSWAMAASIPPAARGAWRAALTHLAVFSVLTVPAVAIWLIATGEGSAVPLVLPAALNFVAFAIPLGHLGALHLSGMGAFFGETESDSQHLWILSDDIDAAVWILVAFAIISALAAAVVLHASGRNQARTTAHVAWAAGIYAAIGAAVTFLGTISMGAGSLGAAGSVSFGPAMWFLLVFAVWGAVVEMLARWVGPALSAVVPAAWVTRAVGTPGVAPQPATAPTAPTAPTATAATTGTDDGVIAAPVEKVALDPKTKKIVIGVGGLIALGVVALIGVSVVNGMFFGPEKQVKNYFAALSDGDAEAAMDMARLDYPSSERVLLNNDVLAEASTIEDVSVGSVETNGDMATVSVDYTVDGADLSQDVTLRKSGSRFGVFDDWVLVDLELGKVRLTAPGASTLKVNGHEVDADGLDDGVSLPAFPGSYSIEPSSGSRYLSYEAQDVSIGTDEESVEFEATPTDALTDEVAAQTATFLDGCIAKREAQPDGCPNQTYAFDLKNVKWKLDRAPTYEVSLDYGGDLKFETATPGSASLTAKRPSFLDDEPAEDYQDEVDIRLSGEVTINGGSVSVQVADYFF